MVVEWSGLERGRADGRVMYVQKVGKSVDTGCLAEYGWNILA